MRDILYNMMYIIITGCGVAIAKYIVDLINKKINEIQINTEISKYDKLNKYVDDAQDAIAKAVLTVSQVYVDSLKNSNSFTPEAQKEAKNKAIEIAKELITEDSKNAILVLYKDYDAFLDATIEAFVKQNKG